MIRRPSHFESNSNSEILVRCCESTISLDKIESALLHDGIDDNHGFSNEWIVQINGYPSDADTLAFNQGYENIGPIEGFDGYYLMRKTNHPILVRNRSLDLSRRLEAHVQVTYAAQLFHKKRVKRGFMQSSVKKRGINMDILRIWDEERRSKLEDLPLQATFIFNDELWDHQWYMQDTRSRSSLPAIHLNVLPVYEMGITGNEVRVVVLDDGLEWRHSDLIDNYDPSISYDFNNGTLGDNDPTPHYPSNSYASPNSHGTRCSGEISMVANNDKCGVGVAYNSKIGGIRMLDGTVNDRIEGLALKYALDKVDIYTASWGPTDDGKTVEGPGILAQTALKQGVEKGRRGKGSIYVWAAGNGGVFIPIIAIVMDILRVFIQYPLGVHLKEGISLAYTDQKIATTDTNDTCTVSHTGTSAAAPLAAGVIALTLEANPNLTWRDVQHLIVYSSSTNGILKNKGWELNAAGYAFNSRFGFGVMDAATMTKNAMKWKKCVSPGLSKTYLGQPGNRDLAPGFPVEILFNIGYERPQRVRSGDDQIKYLEHIQVVTTIKYAVRGSLEIVLRSPQGTTSQLLTRRENDKSDAGFKDWSFMSVHFWGENPEGIWELMVVDRGSEIGSGQIMDAKLILHGVAIQPSYMKIPKKYSSKV
ncbi:PCSK1 [Lepeophtheirus salmonis]|uniref:PCSK1 n=1 Tax=Lepeophtheirus salmonis TaxID=72036 RepID=A0A7R8CVB0_LEPSM|nr:PCSK1 [Lepeophtheirus salmonis]CAF2943484.1 PCSK1 [Lepeophtheirus salmonis]